MADEYHAFYNDPSNASMKNCLNDSSLSEEERTAQFVTQMAFGSELEEKFDSNVYASVDYGAIV